MVDRFDTGVDAQPDGRGCSMTSIYQNAQRYKGRGWTVTALNGKAPILKNWTERGAEDTEVWERLQQGANVGVLLGAPSKNLVDVDLDCEESVRVAPHTLPPTEAVFGTDKKPKSHYLYYVDNEPKTKRYEGERGVTVELRGTGAQTRFPPSQGVSWNCEGEPTSVTLAALQAAVEETAVVSDVAQHWADGKRHDMALTLAGALKNSGWQLEDTLEFVSLVCVAAADTEAADRTRAVQDTYAEKGPTTGWPRLSDLLGQRCAARLERYVRNQGDSPTAHQEPGTSVEVDSATTPPARFEQDESGMYEWRNSRGRANREQIANFRAVIRKQVEHNDGRETRRIFVIEATVDGTPRTIEVDAADFDSMTWVTIQLGAKAMVMPHRHEAVRAAIHFFSKECETEHRFGHSGWERLNGQWCYLHSGGAIDANGNNDSVSCSLPSSLAPIRLEFVVETLHDDVEAALRFARLRPASVVLPLLAATVRTCIGHCGLNLLIFGKTGTRKTAVAALAQAFFGAEFNNTRLPASFQSTANALEQVAYLAKDAVVTIDDYCPNPSARDASTAEGTIDRVVRSNTETSGRARVTQGGRLIDARPPRCTFIATAETLPAKTSLRARAVMLDQGRGVTDLQALTKCQEDAAAGCYARVTAAFVGWLAPRLEDVRRRVAKREGELLRELQAGGHGRTPHMAARLQAGWEVFLTFLVESHCIAAAEQDELKKALRAEVMAWREQQAKLVAESDPVDVVLRGVVTALATGSVHLTNRGGGQPAVGDGEWGRFGWKQSAAGEFGTPQPCGKRIGVVDDELVFLLPGPAIDAARGVLGSDVTALPDVRRFVDELKARGLLARTESARGTNQVRVSIGNERLPTACIRLATLFSTQEVPS